MPSDNRPNILFLFTDQHRPDWLGSNPDVPVRTPNIDALASEGVRFDDAICPSPLCAPSRAAIASGYEYDRCGVLSNSMEYPYDQPVYHRRLRDEADYHVMGCGKMHIGHTEFTSRRNFSWDTSGTNLLEFWGFSDGLFNEGKVQSAFLADDGPPGRHGPYAAYLKEQGWLQEHVDDYKRRSGVSASESLPREPGIDNETFWTSTFPTPLPDDVYFDNWIGRNGLQLLDDAPTDEPWFLQVNFQNPHHPWDITESMHNWYRDPPVDFPGPTNSKLGIAEETHIEIRRNYAAMVEHLDTWLGRFLGKLQERGERDQTLVVFSSDHGEMLGDHGQWQKLSPLQMSIGVPLVVAGPDVESRPPVDSPTTILDLHATFLDIAGVDPGDVDSRSMRPYLAGETDQHRDVVYSGLGPWRLVYDGRYKLIRGYDPDERYRATSEPFEITPRETTRLLRARDSILHDVPESETRNVAGQHPEVVDRLSAELKQFRGVSP